jgi:diguanylate cyclase (GGDEF)-like protein/PAS domain S-box-containing protein
MRVIKTGANHRADSDARARQLEQVLEQSGEAVIVKDLDAVVTYWNREAGSLYGYSAEEAVGQSLRKLHAASLSEADYAKVLERVRSGKPTTSSADRRKKNGELVRVALKTTPLLDPQGRLMGEITVARDITILHRTEEALRTAKQALEAKLEAIKESNRSLAREAAAHRKTEEAMRIANQALATNVRQLEAFHRDGEALSRMAELLQSCTRRKEAYAVVQETASQLFQGVPGALYIFRESRDVLEHTGSWGFAASPEPVISPEDCWALRLGRPHFVTRKGAVRCQHAQQDCSYACMPVLGQGQVLGMLHMGIETGGRGAQAGGDGERRLRALTDTIGPALANLKLRDALRELALRDTLTGLYNRRYMEESMVRELPRAERSGKPVSMIMIDIDHFKQFNDKHGHDAGDFVLSAVARAIAKNVRPSDIVCRYGGEELVVVLPECSLQSAHERAESLRLVVRATNLVHLGQTLPAPSASFGVAVYPAHGSKLADVLKAADSALYKAKQSGRDRVCIAEMPQPEATPEEASPAAGTAA